MRVLGIDYGERRIGISLSDPTGTIANPVGNIIRRSDEQAIDEICRFVSENCVEKIVIGNPKNMNGTIGTRAQKSQEIHDILSEKLEIPVCLWDERLTTVAAHKVLNEANVRGKKRKNAVDSMAATLILQGFLDSCTTK